MTHTPGPWKASRDKTLLGQTGWRIDSDSVSLMVWLSDGYGDMGDEIEANVHLIEAAPDMVKACDPLYHTEWPHRIFDIVNKQSPDLADRFAEVMHDITAAIAKARGKEAS